MMKQARKCGTKTGTNITRYGPHVDGEMGRHGAGWCNNGKHGARFSRAFVAVGIHGDNFWRASSSQNVSC